MVEGTEKIFNKNTRHSVVRGGRKMEFFYDYPASGNDDLDRSEIELDSDLKKHP